MRWLALFLGVMLGGAVPALHAQTSNKVWRLGVLSPIDSGMIRSIVLPELARNGFIEGQNLIVDSRLGSADELPDLARLVVAAKPDAIMAISDWAIQPLRKATSTVPIIMSPVGQDPVSTGMVATWAKPGGNVTGIVLPAPELDGKRVGLLHEIAPAARRIAVLTTHETPNEEIRAAAAQVGLELIEFSATGPSEYADSFE